MSGPTNAVSQPTLRSSPATTDRRRARHEATRREIVDAAWAMVRAEGLASLSMRSLGERVGMRAQSLYSYFANKDALLDALFRDANEQLLTWMRPVVEADAETDPIGYLRAGVRRHFEFCVVDPVRYELLFQRTLPGFTPSAESYAVAVEVLELMVGSLERAGVTETGALDLWTAVTTGMTSQQLANDPGGDRWERLLDRAVHMLVAETAPHLLARPDPPPPPTTRRRAR